MARKKVRTSGKNRRIYLVQGTCTVAECSCLLVRHDASLCASVVPKPFHRPHPSTSQAPSTRTTRGPEWCSSHTVITTIFERLLELSWKSRDYAAVSALFARKGNHLHPEQRTNTLFDRNSLFSERWHAASHRKKRLPQETLGRRAT